MTHPGLKERVRNGETCVGTFLLFLSGGDVVELLVGLGFDYFILDMEHSTLDLARARETILAARAHGLAPLVRVPELQYHLVTRLLDAGAEGIVLPRMETRAEAEGLVRCARYRPEGERGISTFAGQNEFSHITDVPAFLAERNRRVLLMAQIETATGVAQREAILSTPGLDACLIGTGDLAMGLGLAGQPDHPRVLEETEKVLATASEHGLLATVPIRRPQDVAVWKQRGMKLLTLSTDGGFLSAGATPFVSAAREER